MKENAWNTIEEFLDENQYEFIHVDNDAEYQEEIDQIENDNEVMIQEINGKKAKDLKCKEWRPVKRRICRWKHGKYVCITHTRYECVKR